MSDLQSASEHEREMRRLARIAGLTSNEMTRAFAALGRLQNVYVDIRIEHWERFGLTTGQLRLMLAINGAPEGSLTVGEIAEILHVSTPTITKMIDRLVRRHMVRRVADPSDRRVSRTMLTPLGADMLEGVSAPGRLRIAKLFAAMDQSDARQFIRLFEEFLREEAELRAHGSK